MIRIMNFTTKLVTPKSRNTKHIKLSIVKMVCFKWLFTIVLIYQVNVILARTLNLRQQKAGCTINLDSSSPSYPPHLIDSQKNVILPKMVGSSRVITLDLDQEVTIGCVGDGNYIKNTGMQLSPATCLSSSNLLVDGVELPYSQTGCLKQNKEVLIENGTCANGFGTVIRIGWQAGPDFIPLYDTCHDKVAASNYFSTSFIYGSSAAADDSSNERPSFSQGGYFPGLDVNTAYSQAEQTKTIAGIVGSSSLATQYVVPNSQVFLSRGHMAPDGDFIDAASQDASYYFLNTAPQWQCFNGANWNVLENTIRNLAINRDVKLTIYTGTFDILTLADMNGVQQRIYLAFDENNNGLIPVPKYYWKLIHDPVSNTATAVLGINNPHISKVLAEDIICPNVCNQIPWISSSSISFTDIYKGYTFCCTAAELRKAINFAPDLDVPLFV